MNGQQESSNTAHSLYAFYETLPDAVQREFLSELVQKETSRTRRPLFGLQTSQRRERFFR